MLVVLPVPFCGVAVDYLVRQCEGLVASLAISALALLLMKTRR
jgi:hypothetical protein